tara:strand:+ start:1961 stop:3445 length:1485 start_codon:yes stop_codon:yes gene_type:complete
MRKTLSGMALTSVLLAMLPGVATADMFKRHHDHVLGTSLDIVVNAPSEIDADKAEEAILKEIERLRGVFSTYDNSSEISRLNRSIDTTVSDDMVRVLERCEAYRMQTSNALSCRIGSLIDTWAVAERENKLPNRPAMRITAGEIRRASVEIDAGKGTVNRPDEVIFATDSLAKGYILDTAVEAAIAASPKVSGLLMNIGGDIRTWGAGPQDGQWAVAITRGSELGEGGSALEGRVQINEGAVATSGSGPRDRMVGGQPYSHVISPADGWPVFHALTATVYASDAITADALATALLVMDLKRGLNLVESLPGVEAEIVTEDERHHQTSGWGGLKPEGKATSEIEASWPTGYEFSIEFEIPDQDIADYERPYVAVWIADKDRNLVRILMLAGQQARWMEENYYWHRRFGRKAGSLVDAISGPTRRPGQYKLVWDGRTDDGHTVGPGEYILHLEAAREHGEHQHESVTFTLSADVFNHEIEPGNELGHVSVRFGSTD